MDTIFKLFSRAKVAIHTMKHEHFGIAIVELMASGIVVVAHDSAGPKQDIIGKSQNKVGFLANNLEEFSFAVSLALKNYDEDQIMQIRKNGRDWAVKHFGVSAFERGFVD